MHLDFIQVDVVQVGELARNFGALGNIRRLFQKHDTLDDLVQIEITQQGLILFTMCDHCHDFRVVLAQIMRQRDIAESVNKRNRLFAVVAYTTVNLRTGEFVSEIADRLCQFVQLWQRRRRQNHVRDAIFAPVLLNRRMQVVVFVVQGNGRLVPIDDQVFHRIECHHIIHGRQIGFQVANHYLDLVADAVVNLSDAAGALILRIFLGGIIMQANIVGARTAKGKRDLFLDGNGGLGEGQTDVSRGAHKDDLVGFGNADG